MIWNKPDNVTAVALDGDYQPYSTEYMLLTFDGWDKQPSGFGSQFIKSPPLPVPKGFTTVCNWLNYTPGKIAFTYLIADTLTGYLNGCPIYTFTLNGRTCVGHIGTYDNPQVSQAMKRKVALSMPTNAVGCKPHEAWTFDEQIAAMGMVEGKTKPNIICLVTASGAFYSILLLRKEGTGKPRADEHVIGGIKRLQPLSHAAFRNSLDPTLFP